MKKKLSLLLAAAMLVTSLSGCFNNTPGSDSSGSQSGVSSSVPDGSDSSAGASSSAGSSSGDDAPDVSTPRQADLNFMVLSGPTGVGAAWLIDQYALESAAEDAPLVLNVSVEADNQVVSNSLMNKEADIAAISTNVAANLAAKSNGAIQVLGINTLGVLYILEKGSSVETLSDLRGKTVYATGQGANPEFILNYLLTENDVDPASVDIQWMTAQEVTAKMTTEEAAICMLPVPAATAVMMKDSNVRQAISLSEVWDRLEQGALAQGCIVARTDFVEEHPELVADFMDLYSQSIAYMNEEGNRSQAAELVANYGITANAQIAAKAIPQCNLTFITGSAMKDTLEQFYQVLYQANPASIGGAMPYDSFYYGVE